MKSNYITFIFFLNLFFITACHKSLPEKNNFKKLINPLMQSSNISGMQKIIFMDVEIGSGKLIAPYATVFVKYTSYLSNGTIFDTTQWRGDRPIKVSLKGHDALPAIATLIPGMKVGGTRFSRIDFSRAYGEFGMGSRVPPMENIYLEIQVTGIEE